MAQNIRCVTCVYYNTVIRRILRRTIAIKIFIHVVLAQAKNIGQI